MLHPQLPKEFDGLQVNLLVEHSLAERTKKPDKPVEVGFRARLKDQEDPEEVWWKLKDKTDKGAQEVIDDEVLPAIRELLPRLEKTPAGEPYKPSAGDLGTVQLRAALAQMGMTLNPQKVE